MLSRASTAIPIPGVLFAQDFSDDDELELLAVDGSPGAITPIPEAIIVGGPSAEQIEEGLLAARQEGFEAGLKAAQHGTIAQRTEILRRLDEALAHTRDDARDAVDNGLALLTDAVLSALMECLPAMCAQHGVNEMRHIVRAMLPTLAEELQLIVSAHPDTEEALRHEITGLRTKSERIKIVLSDAMLVGDITVRWTDGSASRDISRWQADMIRHLLELRTNDTVGAAR